MKSAQSLSIAFHKQIVEPLRRVVPLKILHISVKIGTTKIVIFLGYNEF